MATYQMCTNCVMDNASDETIRFDENGICDYCKTASSRIGTVYLPNDDGKKKLDDLLSRVKRGGGKYDCIMGLSGGLDSSYLAYLGYKWKLKVLALHVDDGYDTEVSKRNLTHLIEATEFDYKVIKPDVQQFNGLTAAYMRAGVPNLANPQDNVLFANIYRYMRENHIHYFLSGGNFALESILQRGNTYKTYDLVNMCDINRQYGQCGIERLDLISTMRVLIDKRLLHIESPRPLNYIDYNREQAFKELNDFCEFEYYGGKHLENILTAFVQLYWFPKKFNVDKRKSHLSSMIVSGQISRAEALQELENPLYDEAIMAEYIEIIKCRLGIGDAEFERIMNAHGRQHNEFKVEDNLLLYRAIQRIVSFRRKGLR